MTNLGET